MIFIFLSTNGIVTNLFTSELYLSSLGFTAIAVSPSIVSGLVVAIVINSSEFSIGYLIWYNFEFTSLWSTSKSEIAVLRTTSQLTNFFDL